MIRRFNQFQADEAGAVSVEWIVLTAAVIGLTVSAYSATSAASGSLTGNTDTTLSTMTVGDPLNEN